MKKFANAEIEVVKFDNAVIATSSCTDITKADGYDECHYYYSVDPDGQESGISFEEYLGLLGSSFDAAINMII